ncbi:RNA pyrophosphohydrolase [Rhodothalassium salexigens]|uniref:RNA pyrophosphohydrolase n=1 Tax=Rhodothalassium salexigens TaxID=1086 RepID=UPI001912C712|nr:RNA pyrophosphohydrolase [Rhodothalassium salexigens]MBK5911039.1 RNA pyrophosphohydrolase [Rhodothalassium salexigens]MBK5920414.1 RNA pyrophosphohydrolase [Rhodothalassium salexigens]
MASPNPDLPRPAPAPTDDPDALRARLPYRPCVGIMLINRAGLVFVGQRIDTQVDAWQMPQGGIDPGESADEAAHRELLEEVGTDEVAVLSRTRDWLSYDLPDSLLGRVWGGRYRGQRQHWYAMRLTGAEERIDIATDHPEFEDWTWVEAPRLPALAIPFKRRVYEQVVAELGHLAQPLRT